MIEPPKEMGLEDFDYFIVVKGMMVAGIYADDENNVYGVHLKGDAAQKGSVMSCPKDQFVEQIEAGLAKIMSDPEKAMAEGIGDTVPEEDENENEDEP
jgi:hypothetical protein